jgi:ABC-2 type transport system ATP-binding protein
MIRAEGLTKRYGALEALADLSLEVARGEILALVGPNGAGKTTALRLLVGLLEPTAGEAWVGGRSIARQPLEAKRLLAYLPDQPFLYEQLTVAEHIGFIGGMYGMAPAALRERAGRLADTFGLTEHLGRRIGQLSYGMKSRLALLLSVLHEPQALILDEPFFGLDPRTTRLVKQLCAEWARGGMGILFSSHQLSVVEDLAHRVAVLSRGRLVALGTCAQLRQQHGGSRLEEAFFNLTEPPEAGGPA